MSCRICDGGDDTRAGVCFTCAGFESLIAEKLDMHDNPVKMVIDGSESLNILYAIVSKHKKEKQDE